MHSNINISNFANFSSLEEKNYYTACTEMYYGNIKSLVYNVACKYATPSNLNYFWNFGVFAFVALLIQIITGIILVMHYTPNIEYAFYSVEHIMRDINYGWLLRYVHANGASLFFIVVYLHVFRGLLYGSYLVGRKALWCTGVIILLLMILTAFLGYILPWGQMSLWGATVITNLASTIPLVGEQIVWWLWGGFSVANPTLTKFFSLHYLFPFLILLLVVGHLFLLHITGSNNPLGINYVVDKVPFAPYYIVKDVLSLHIFLIFFCVLVFFMPNALGHPDNYIEANPDITPEHIVPEWYFLPFYAILRAIPSKGLGVFALLASIIVLFLLPFLHQGTLRTAINKPIYNFILLIFLGTTILLAYVGGKPIEYPFLVLGQVLTAMYFLFFVLVTFLERIDYYLLKFMFYSAN